MKVIVFVLIGFLWIYKIFASKNFSITVHTAAYNNGCGKKIRRTRTLNVNFSMHTGGILIGIKHSRTELNWCSDSSTLAVCLVVARCRDTVLFKSKRMPKKLTNKLEQIQCSTEYFAVSWRMQNNILLYR